ncbi:MAG: hypothetical protein KGL39_44705, partial [Patescibacteria group bacterium]|nr:hypothetical protein [Patescibacteria group bacterium]
MPKDKALHLEVYAPAAGATATVNPLDLNVDVPSFNDNWRQGRLRITWPAMPNSVNAANAVNVTLQDSNDFGATYANTNPLIQV